jgi:choice-of-anchor B domain-containing protein
MQQVHTSERRRPGVTAVVVAVVAAWLLVPTAAAAHPGGLHPGDDHAPTGITVEVTAPADLVGFLPAVQWGDSGAVDDQAGRLVYAGTGCTPASYAAVAAEIRGNIALVDSRQSAADPVDQCPASTFFQKVQSAQAAGAIGFVQIPAEGDEPRGNATAITADIPALEVERTDAALAVRDAVVAGTAVEAALRDTQEPVEPLSDVPCVDGQAGPYACDGVDLLSLVPQEAFNGAGVSDLWGWTDPDSGDEYVIIGKTNGVAFFRITDPTAPIYLGELPNPGAVQAVWHDIKVYEDHAFIVSESEPHGMTIFDLRRLRAVDAPQEWDADANYRLHSAAHNVEINTDTGFAYIVGGNAGLVVPDQCLSGLHMVDIREPQQPTFAGCYLEEGGPGTLARSAGDPVQEHSPAAYVHDTQCVVYDGPDAEHAGREICFNSAEDKVVIVDVTDKSAPVTLGVTSYPNVAYTHQGWLTEDHAYLLVNDELDEQTYGIDTRTVVLDVTDLDDPKLHFEHTHDTQAITHNNYVDDGLLYQSNYAAGLRVLDVAGVASGSMEEIAFFDTYPAHSDATFDGTWSNYPFFESGTIAVSGRAEGLFLLRLRDEVIEVPSPGVEVTCTDCPVEVRAGESGSASLAVTNTGNVDDAYDVVVSGAPDGWTVSSDPTRVSLDAGAAAGVDLTIETPRNAQAGAYPLTVTVTSHGYDGVTASETIPVDVRKGKPSSAGGPETDDAQGQGAGKGAGSNEGAGAAEPEVVTATAARSSSGGPAVPAAVLLVLAGSLLVARSLRRRLVS